MPVAKHRRSDHLHLSNSDTESFPPTFATEEIIKKNNCHIRSLRITIRGLISWNVVSALPNPGLIATQVTRSVRLDPLNENGPRSLHFIHRMSYPIDLNASKQLSIKGLK